MAFSIGDKVRCVDHSGLPNNHLLCDEDKVHEVEAIVRNSISLRGDNGRLWFQRRFVLVKKDADSLDDAVLKAFKEALA